MNEIAERYVKLALALGELDANYVDAYYGPPEWKAEVSGLTAQEIASRAADLSRELDGEDPRPDEMSRLRKANLAKQVGGLHTRARMVSGESFPFDVESKGLYDVVDSGHPDVYYDAVLSELEPLLPGEGALAERYDRYKSKFDIPRDRLEDVFAACISAARERTKRFIAMPEDETFSTEYVDKQVWGAYNWYKGNSHSLIQINTDFPLSAGHILHLALHEGYPGHHVYNALLERDLAKQRGWMEFTVYPLYSPQSLIAEGTAEYGAELAFPQADSLAFEREVVFPMAGIDPDLAEPFAIIRRLAAKLGYASNDAARRYLDGQAKREETIDWLSRCGLTSRARAEQRVRFIEAHRSYVVTYNVGLDLVREYVESRATDVAGRWRVFEDLLRVPRTASALSAA